MGGLTYLAGGHFREGGRVVQTHKGFNYLTAGWGGKWTHLYSINHHSICLSIWLIKLPHVTSTRMEDFFFLPFLV